MLIQIVIIKHIKAILMKNLLHMLNQIIIIKHIQTIIMIIQINMEIDIICDDFDFIIYKY